MPKIGDFDIKTTILCDDVRQESGTGKYILIGVFTGDILVREFPAQVQLALYIEIDGPAGHHDVELRLSGPQAGEGILNISLDAETDGVGAVTTPRITVAMESEGTFRADWRVAGGDWENILSKQVRLLDPTVFRQPS